MVHIYPDLYMYTTSFTFVLLLGAGRRPSQGSASVFCYYYFLCFLCSEFPARVRLQSLNSVTKSEHIQRGRNFCHLEAGRRYKVTAKITSATPRRMK